MGPKLERRPLHRGDPESMLRKATTTRDRALVVLLWRAGLRATEACNIRCQDFEFRRDGSVLIHVVVAKGGRQRWAGIGKEYARHIKAHLRKRKTGIFMQTGTGKVMHRTQVSRTVKLLGQRARLSGRFHPHVLRHCFARDLHDEGWSLEEIRVSLGHKNLNTTQIYLQDLGIDAVMHKLTNRK